MGGAAGVDALLADGRVVHLRQPCPDDRDALVELHARLSDRSSYLRYFTASRLSGTRYVDQLLAPGGDPRRALLGELGGRPVAVASYAPLPDECEAEVGLLVEDAQQGSGIGTLLLEHLAAAAADRGVCRFVAEVLADNAQMLDVFGRAGFAVDRQFADGVVHVTFPLEPSEELLRRVDERDRVADVHSLEALFRPRGVAVFGEAADRGRRGEGARVVAHLRAGGFTGAVYPVQPGAGRVGGRPALDRLEQADGPVDLAVLALPADRVAAAARACAAAGVRVLAVLSAGFAEAGADGAAREQELLGICRAAGMRVLGPNSLGVLSTEPGVRLQATLADLAPLPGRLAVATQSGALGVAMVAEATRLGVGVARLVALGNKADVSGNDLLLCWERDDAVGAVGLYLESFGNPRKFARIARRVARSKPILAVTAGRSEPAGRTVRLHTAAGPPPAEAVEALFRQAGVLRVDSAADLVPLAGVLLRQPPPAGRRLAVLGNAGGPAALAADAAVAAGLEVVALGEPTRAALRLLVPAAVSTANPVDLTTGATAAGYAAALRVVLADPAVDAAVVVHSVLRRGRGVPVSAALAAAGAAAGKPVVLVHIGVDPAERVDPAGPPTFGYPEPAVRALARAAEYAFWRARPPGSPVALAGVDLAGARALVRRLPAGRATGTDLATLLACFGIEVGPEGPGAEPAAVELTIGLGHDPLFGPLVRLGLGGPAADLLADRGYALVPVTDTDADDLIRSLRCSPLLFGYRGRPGCDVAALTHLVLRVARLAEGLPQVLELVLAPVLAGPAGVRVLAAEAVLDPAAPQPAGLPVRALPVRPS